MREEIKLGDKVRDTITGFTVIAVARTLWINGCSRINVQPIGTNKEGKLYETESFDEPLLEIIKPKVRKEGKHDTGGPRKTIKW
jgi:hypothetical protein